MHVHLNKSISDRPIETSSDVAYFAPAGTRGEVTWYDHANEVAHVAVNAMQSGTGTVARVVFEVKLEDLEAAD